MTEVQQNVLGSATDGNNPFLAKDASESTRHRPAKTPLADQYRFNSSIYHRRTHPSHGRFYFREFRHPTSPHGNAQPNTPSGFYKMFSSRYSAYDLRHIRRTFARRRAKINAKLNSKLTADYGLSGNQSEDREFVLG